MIDPKNIINFQRTTGEKQEFLLFCISVAGKNSKMMAKKLAKFYDHMDVPQSAEILHLFVEKPAKVYDALVMSKMGQYSRIYNAFLGVAKLFLEKPEMEKWTLDDLLKIKGIGNKTARFFLLYTQVGIKVAVLDTHILKWLRELGHDAPLATPSTEKKYKEMEAVALREFSVYYPFHKIYEADLMLWKYFNEGKRLEKVSY